MSSSDKLTVDNSRKIGHGNLGKKHSEATKKKLSEKKVGVPRSDEFKEHMRSVLGGKKRDPDIGKRISEGHRRKRESNNPTT